VGGAEDLKGRGESRVELVGGAVLVKIVAHRDDKLRRNLGSSCTWRTREEEESGRGGGGGERGRREEDEGGEEGEEGGGRREEGGGGGGGKLFNTAIHSKRLREEKEKGAEVEEKEGEVEGSKRRWKEVEGGGGIPIPAATASWMGVVKGALVSPPKSPMT